MCKYICYYLFGYVIRGISLQRLHLSFFPFLKIICYEAIQFELISEDLFSASGSAASIWN